MQRSKNARTERGITLIALIITIIVILILVAVSVRTVANSGLFDHAKNATNKWADEQEREANIGDEVGNVIDKYVGEHNWKRNGDNLRCDHCGLSFVIGDYVDYQPDPTSKTITISDKESGASEENQGEVGLSSADIKLATLNTANSSATIKQVDFLPSNRFTQDAKTYWQVLGIEDSDGNGTNETLLIKMAIGTNDVLRLKGAAAYNNGPDIMNRICKELYSSSKYGEARSINITDINNTLQYTPGGGSYYDSGYKELSGFNTQMKDIPTWNTVKGNGTYTPDGTNTEAKLGSYKIDGYAYVLGDFNMSFNIQKDSNKIAKMSLTNENQTTIIRTESAGTPEIPTYITNQVTGATTTVTENTRNVVFFYPDNSSPCSYWLACRGVDVSARCVIFGPGSVFYGYADSCYGCFRSDGAVDVCDLPVCPVISLRSEIPAKIPTPDLSPN